jgi:hypothetical protein
MYKWPLLCILLMTARSLPAQHTATLRAQPIALPDTATFSVAQIARYVEAHCPTVPVKIHTLYSWVTNNIAYDTDSMYHYNWSKPNATVAATTLRRRKGVCENYAALLKELLVASGIPAWVVTGYTRQPGGVNYNGHSWCAVQADGEWWLCDPTWQATERESARWLMVAPADFLQTHIPFDPMWQLQYDPISHKDFKQGRTEPRRPAERFNYPDTLQAFWALDSLQQLEALARRMYRAGLENSRLQLWHTYNEMRIAIIYGDQDMELYNTAVALFNEATGIFNGYVRYRNNLFAPQRPDAELATLLTPIAGLMQEAERHLNQMGRVVENFQYDTGALRERIGALRKKVQEQQDFLKRYLATPVGERRRLF